MVKKGAKTKTASIWVGVCVCAVVPPYAGDAQADDDRHFMSVIPTFIYALSMLEISVAVESFLNFFLFFKNKNSSVFIVKNKVDNKGGEPAGLYICSFENK